MVSHRAPEQRCDDDFEAIRRGLNEAIAHAKGEPEADGVRIHVPDESPAKHARRLRLTLGRLDYDVYAGQAHRCSRLSEAIFIDPLRAEFDRDLGSHPI